jgi:hypothetical protein
MGIERVASAAKIEHDRVAVGLLNRDVGRHFAGRLIGQAIDHRDHRCVSYRKHIAPVDRIARRLDLGTSIDATLGVKLFPIDRAATATINRFRKKVAGRTGCRICSTTSEPAERYPGLRRT